MAFEWLKYWEGRYARGVSSGRKCAEFKAEVVNSIVKEYNICSVIDFGCGDGEQASLAAYPAYIGLDISKTAVELCKERFKHDKTKSFFLYKPNCFAARYPAFKAELGLSMNVIFHLVDDKIYDLYMRHLCSTAKRFMIIYSTDTDEQFQPRQAQHMKHHCFSKWIEREHPEWKLLKRIPNRYPEVSSSTFFVYEKKGQGIDNE